MLQITVKGTSGVFWDEAKEEFIHKKPQKDIVLRLEHSLISISKWESKWHKAFVEKNEKSDIETIDYIKCMTLNQDVPDDVYTRLSMENIKEIKAYIEDPMTATVINAVDKHKVNNEFITSELVYYWMILYGIPSQFEKWHFNRLITLIRVCSEKNKPQKKMSAAEQAAMYKRINERNRALLHTRG